MNKKLIALLQEEFKTLLKSAGVLKLSLSNCHEIGIKDEFTPDELEKFEAMCSRFARASDILIQRIFRLSHLSFDRCARQTVSHPVDNCAGTSRMCCAFANEEKLDIPLYPLSPPKESAWLFGVHRTYPLYRGHYLLQ
ncbi:MAG: hypothetical protein HYY40_11260 [Bacteroidetes bacterium]|nr:hypothetical protein [Bacteroidota bacterium]